MQNKTSKNSQPLDGVTCNVVTCEYHGEGSSCLAKTIKVGPDAASDSTDTECDTFKCTK